MGRSSPTLGAKKELALKKISKQDKKELEILADDFGLLHRKDVREIIENCRSYSEGQRRILRVYTTVLFVIAKG